MALVDTNVLVHAADRRSRHHEACLAWLEARRRQPDAWFSTWAIAYEFLRVVTHPRVLREPWTVGKAWTFIEALLHSPGFEMLGPTRRHAEVATDLVARSPFLAGNILHDAHTAILMREHGVRRICTRDADFHRFTFLEVVDPVAG